MAAPCYFTARDLATLHVITAAASCQDRGTSGNAPPLSVTRNVNCAEGRSLEERPRVLRQARMGGRRSMPRWTTKSHRGRDRRHARGACARGTGKNPRRMGGRSGLAHSGPVRQARPRQAPGKSYVLEPVYFSASPAQITAMSVGSWRSRRSVSRAFRLPCRTPGSLICASSPTRSRTAARITSPPTTW